MEHNVVKKGSHEGKQHCQIMKNAEHGIVIQNIKSKEFANQIAESVATLAVHLGIANGENPEKVCKQLAFVDDQGQHDLVILTPKETINSQKINLLKNVYNNCMSIEEYRRNYCCDPICSKNKGDQLNE